MNGVSGRALIAALADSAASADPAVTAVMERLAGLGGAGWLRLDELARRPYWGESPLDAVADWLPFLAGDGNPAGAVAASMCRDGRVREAAVAVLARLPGPAAAAALAVRTADWVPEVRSAARSAVSARIGPQDAAAIIPVFLVLRQRRRGRQAAAGYLASLAQGPAAVLEALAATDDRGCRLWALEALAERALPGARMLADLAMRDPDPVVALWCAKSLADPSGELSAAAGQRLLGSARVGVRAFAAGHLSDDQLTRQALAGLLLDRSGAVRTAARWRWRRRWGDAGPFYRSVLAGAGRPRQIVAALQGLDEDGDGSLPAIAVPFLAHPSPAVRRAAAQAVGRHGDPGDITGHLVPLLHDSSGKVAGVALRHLRGHPLPDSVLASLDAAGTAHARRTALAVRQHSGTWNRVHADLAAINGQDPDLAEAARTDLIAWLQHGAATSYGKPADSQAADIARLLATGKLTGKQRREIAFTAGIPIPGRDSAGT